MSEHDLPDITDAKTSLGVLHHQKRWRIDVKIIQINIIVIQSVSNPKSTSHLTNLYAYIYRGVNIDTPLKDLNLTGNLAPSYKTDGIVLKPNRDKKWKMTIQKVHFSLADNPRKFESSKKFENLEGLAFNPKSEFEFFFLES